MYDIGFLILFTAFVIWFLSSRKKQLSREGIIFMYRTQVGVDAINWVGTHCKKTLHALKYLIVGVGFVLMGGMIWMLGKTVLIYVLHSKEIVEMVAAPPIAPLIPYFPKLFGMESFFPPFYFTYFIVALGVVAIVHEFSHGIFMKLFGVKIKSTGLVFLGPILGAFVEEEKKGFHKKKKLEQMTVLAAGVFANIVFALIFYGLYVLFFSTSFTASGYAFNSYGLAEVNVSSIDSVGADVGTLSMLLGGQIADTNLTELMVDGRSYLMGSEFKGAVLNPAFSNLTMVVVEDTDAVRSQIRGAIIQANDVKIKNQNDLMLFLITKNPGDVVNFVTEDKTTMETQEYSLTLSEHPNEAGRAYLGVGHNEVSPRGVIQTVFAKFMSFKDGSIYYKPIRNENFVIFIYHLLWWVMIINLLVALFNMMPLGMLDGGRFFYLTVLSITRHEKTAKWAYKIAGYLILLSFLILMAFWLFEVI